MSMSPRRLLGAALAATSVALAAPAAASAALPVTYNLLGAAQAIVAGPNAAPPGANDWACKPSAAHPRPVVLVHATFVNMGLNWNALSPLLKNNGYCVFAFSYGMNGMSLGGYIGGLGSVAASGDVLAAFVDRVRTATGASKVDLVSHSQGGMVAKYFMSGLGGGAKVHTAVAMAPSMHGTTLSGLTNLGEALRPLAGWLVDGVYAALKAGAPGLRDQAITSEFARSLNTLPDTTGGAKLTVITTKYDAVVTPPSSQQPVGPDTTWIVLQRQCATDYTDHVALAFDSIALRNILNALDPSTARPIRCKVVLPYLGG
jgi:triacylglycerol esterase/lipase EstA (alpha/beta hydrolase family)